MCEEQRKSVSRERREEAPRAESFPRTRSTNRRRCGINSSGFTVLPLCFTVAVTGHTRNATPVVSSFSGVPQKAGWVRLGSVPCSGALIQPAKWCYRASCSMRWSNDSHLAPTTTILLLSRPPPGPPPSYWHLQQCLVLLVTCLLLSHLPSVSASVSAREGQGGKEDAPKTVCGTRFTDIASSALLADVVLEGRVQQMVTPQGEGGPLAPGVRYNVSIQVRRRVWKGRELVNRGKKARKLLVGTFLSSAPIQDSAVVLSDDNGIVRDIVGGSRAGVVEGVDPQIEEGGDELGDCVADVAEGSTYIFFLRNVGHKKGRYFVISAVPVKKNRRASRTVKKILKPNAAKKPSIQRLKGPRAVKAGSSLTLRCKAKAKPNPVFTWFKDGEEVTSRRGLRIKNNKRGSRLKISKADKAAAGVYTCQAANALGEASKNITIKVTTPELIHVACQKQTYCFNGGTCRYIPALHQSFCQCPKQWAGHRCEILDLYGPGNKDKTREAKLEFERVLIIVGIVIALLVFVVICIASYFLANRRRKRWAARRRMKQRLGPESDLLLDKTDGARLTHFAPSSKPLAQKETQTDFNFQPPTYPPNPDLEAKPPNLIHHHAYPKSSANNIFLHDGSFPPPLTCSAAATVAAAAPPPPLPSTISNPKPARPVSNIESRDLERNGLRGRLKAVSVTENGIGDRPWKGMSQVPDSKSMPIILDSEGDMPEVIELNKLGSCPPSSSSPGLNSTRDEVDSLLHMPPVLPDKSQIPEQGGAEDFGFNLLEDGKAPDDSPHFPSYFDSLDPPGEVSKSGTEEGEKKPLPVNGVVDSWESDDEAPDKPLLPLHISEEDLNGNVPRMDSFDLESPSPPLPPHPEPLARDGHSPSLSSLSGSGPVSRPADLPPVPGRDPDQRPGSVSEDDSAGFLPHTLSSTEASSPLTEGTPQGETYAFDPSLDSDPDDLDEQFMHGSPRKGTGCYRGAEDKQDYERRLRNVCADQDAIPI